MRKQKAKPVATFDVVVPVQDALERQVYQDGSHVATYVSGIATVRVEVLADIVREAAYRAIRNSRQQSRRGGVVVKLVGVDAQSRHRRINGGPKQPC